MVIRQMKITRKRGVAIVYTLFSMLLLSIVAFGLLSIINSYAGVARNRQNSIRALQAARSGLAYARVHIQREYMTSDYAGGLPEPVDKTLDDGSRFTITVSAPESNTTSHDKIWFVTSEGFSGEAYRKLEAWMDLVPMTSYSYISNHEEKPPDSKKPDEKSRESWIFPPQAFLGKIHTNKNFNLYQNSFFFNDMTSSNRNDKYYNPDKKTYTQEGKTHKDPSKFYHYYDGYNKDFPSFDGDYKFTGALPVEKIPKSVEELKLGNIKTAVRKEYDVDITVGFTVDGYASVEYKDPTGKTVIEKISTSDIVIYSKGNITIKSDSLVNGSVNMVSGKDIKILGDIMLNNPARDNLVIVAQDNMVIETNSEVAKNLLLEGVLIANEGAMYVKDHATGVYRGDLYIYGSLFQNYRGHIGQIGLDNKYRGYYLNVVQNPMTVMKPPKILPRSMKVRYLSVRDSGAIGN
jgi:hypothetical protein